MEYDIIFEIEYDNFFKKINERLNNGWKLQGGICIVIKYVNNGYFKGNKYYFSQAIYKKTSFINKIKNKFKFGVKNEKNS